MGEEGRKGGDLFEIFFRNSLGENEILPVARDSASFLAKLQADRGALRPTAEKTKDPAIEKLKIYLCPLRSFSMAAARKYISISRY